MSNVAIYPGTFDPITFGHIDVIKKSLKLFDKVIVAVSDGENKKYLFNANERIEIVKKALFSDLKLNKKKIIVISFTSLTTDLCKKYKSNIILRGLRAVSDFEYEFQLAGMNRKLNNNIETLFLMSDVENQIISSRFVKEIPSHLIEEVRVKNTITRPVSFQRPKKTPRLSDDGENTGFYLGQRVSHTMFGEGVILHFEGDGAAARVQVNFSDAGSKWLVLKFAKLEAL